MNKAGASPLTKIARLKP